MIIKEKPIVSDGLFCFLAERGAMTEKSYLTVEEVARRFGVNPTTVYRLAQRGALPGFKVGNQWRFGLEMLESWVSDQVTVGRLKKKDQ